MQPLKKQLEVLLINYFKECYPNFPKGKVEPSESPDFIVTLKSKNNLGIELTRLNPLNASTPDAIQLSQISVRERIIELARTLFEETSPEKLFVKLLFSEKKNIEPKNELSTSVKLVNIVRKAVSQKSPDSFFKIHIKASDLPAGVDSVMIASHPELEASIWERSNNLGVSENVVADIKEAILKKDKKIGLYQKQRLNYYWLLITTDRLRGVKEYNLPGKIINHTFESRFQHVFLLDLIKAEVFQLV